MALLGRMVKVCFYRGRGRYGFMTERREVDNVPRSPSAREFAGVVMLQSIVELQVGGGLEGNESGQLLWHAAASRSLFTTVRCREGQPGRFLRPLTLSSGLLNFNAC